MKLSGYHSISSPSHMSLLVHRTFNVSIPSSHIPQVREGQPDGSAGEETFQFVFGIPSPAQDEEMADDLAFPEEEMGNWVSSSTGLPISGSDGMRSVEFTVIGLTVANSMLSLIGSLQPDPFDSRHSLTATEALATHPVFRRMEAEQEADDIEEVERELSVQPNPMSEEPEDEIREDWTQDNQKPKQHRASTSPAPFTSPPPATQPEPGSELGTEKKKKYDAGAGEEKPKKRKRKNKDLENEMDVDVDGAVDEAQTKPPKKKKKKKMEAKEEGEAHAPEDGTKEKKKKKKKKREVVAEDD